MILKSSWGISIPCYFFKARRIDIDESSAIPNRVGVSGLMRDEDSLTLGINLDGIKLLLNRC